MSVPRPVSLADAHRNLGSNLTLLSFNEHLQNRDDYFRELTGMDTASLARYADGAASTMLAGHPMASRYPPDLLRRALWASAAYESLARTPGEAVTDRLQAARDANPSMGPFQAYAGETSRALTRPEVRAWLAAYGDTEARAFVVGLTGRETAAQIQGRLEGVSSPLHSSAALSLVGKMQLTLDYVEETDRKNPFLRSFSPDMLQRAWMDGETGAGRDFWIDGGLRRRYAAAAPGSAIHLPPGHLRMRMACDALGIPYDRAATLLR